MPIWDFDDPKQAVDYMLRSFKKEDLSEARGLAPMHFKRIVSFFVDEMVRTKKKNVPLSERLAGELPIWPSARSRVAHLTKWRAEFNRRYKTL